MRDGISPEEDLAVRALLPEWRPKRGRRKAEDIEAEAEAYSSNKKVQVRGGSAEFSSVFEEQYSATPSSAKWGIHTQEVDPWAAAQVAIAPTTPGASQTPTQHQVNAHVTAQQMQWRFGSTETPSSPYPQSAVTPRNTFAASTSFDEPKSAHPSTNMSKSPSRGRRRHGPAVSSAWLSNSNTVSGKLRGRPPNNRSVQDGPFSTFPAKPNAKETTSANAGTPTLATPSPGREVDTNTPPITIGIQQHATVERQLPKKPSKLQLQVPEHCGGPVRLATPPRVLINGEVNGQMFYDHQRKSSVEFFNQLDEPSERDESDGDGEDGDIDWKRRALMLKRKLIEKEEELKNVKRRVLDAVM